MLRSQTLINQLWQLELNYPDTVSWSASALNGAYLITTGNTFNGISQKTNIATTKTDQGGAVVWQAEYNGPLSGFDYGAAIAVDAAGNVFIAGASHASDAYSFDVVVIKYNAAGVQQWATTFDGEANANDIPSAILLIGTDIYVCAASIGAASNYDYLLLKLNAAGAVLWNARYDYADLDDIPGHIAAAAADIIVSGASQSDTANWDYTSLKYNSSGTLINTKRTAAPGYGFDRPSGLVVDASGNFYISGYAFNGTDYDMRTIKLDDDLSTLWSKTENGGAQDGCNAICMDDGSNIYIAGFSENSAGNKCMQIIKYDSSGTKLWTKTLQNAGSDIRAEVTGITFNSENNKLIATGFYEYPSGKKTITTFAIKTANGNINWKKDYPNIAESIDVPTGVLAKNNYVWVNGRRTVEDTTRYVTVKYEMWEKVDEYSADTSYVKDQIIIRFSPYNVKDEFVNSANKVYESLSNVVDSSTYGKIQAILCNRTPQCNPTTVKVYKRFTKGDSISVTRLGSTIKNDKLWSTMLIMLPEDSDIDYILDTLNNMLPEVIYAQKNYLSVLMDIPNDEEWPNQHSLFSTVFPDAHINVELAWDFEHGNAEVRVGVYDTGIDWEHEDFHLTTDDNSFADSKIEGGYDYGNLTDISLSESPDPNGHGTSCAGIIGALRNNESTVSPTEFVGISGIVGGDVENDNNTGCPLYAMKLVDNSSAFVSTEKIVQSYQEGWNIFGLDVTSHSYAGVNYEPAQFEALNFLYRNEVIFLAARGNFPNTLGTDIDDPLYPACFDDGRVLTVGANGWDGERKVNGNGNPLDPDDNAYYSMEGCAIDVIAPGTNRIVLSTDANTDGYTGFNGTSAATPHVAGVAALMLSFYGNTLAPEDIENVLQNNADNIGAEPFNEVGFGKIDAVATIEEIELPQHQILHYAGTTDTYTETPVATFQPLYLIEYFDGYFGPYYGTLYDITYTINHTIPATATFLDGWVRNSTTEGYRLTYSIPSGDDYYILPQPSGSVEVLITATSAKITTRVYKITHNFFTGAAITNKWIPESPSSILLNYSLHIFDPTATSDVAELSNKDSEIKIYPNPASEQMSVYLASGTNEVSYEVFGMDGKVMMRQSGITLSDNHTFSINVSDLSGGIYVLKITGNHLASSTKFIIQ